MDVHSIDPLYIYDCTVLFEYLVREKNCVNCNCIFLEWEENSFSLPTWSKIKILNLKVYLIIAVSAFSGVPCKRKCNVSVPLSEPIPTD